MRILIVDDEPAVLAAVDRALRLDGYQTVPVGDGEAALRAVSSARPDAIVLDVLLPGMDGLELCRRLRAIGDRTPVLMLTARDAISERVAGLDAGADDYMVKPFALEELLARLRALLRRHASDQADPGGPALIGLEATAEEAGILSQGDLRLDTVAYQAWRGERLLDLTRTEMSLLELLLRHPNQVLTRSVILDRVWGYDFTTTSNSLEVYIGYLRRKTEAGGEARLIHTVRGVGYVLRPPAALPDQAGPGPPGDPRP